MSAGGQIKGDKIKGTDEGGRPSFVEHRGIKTSKGERGGKHSNPFGGDRGRKVPRRVSQRAGAEGEGNKLHEHLAKGCAVSRARLQREIGLGSRSRP